MKALVNCEIFANLHFQLLQLVVTSSWLVVRLGNAAWQQTHNCHTFKPVFWRCANCEKSGTRAALGLLVLYIGRTTSSDSFAYAKCPSLRPSTIEENLAMNGGNWVEPSLLELWLLGGVDHEPCSVHCLGSSCHCLQPLQGRVVRQVIDYRKSYITLHCSSGPHHK